MKGQDARPEKTGILFGIGVGPGNPDLLTLRAARILSTVPTLAVPKSVSDGGSLALDAVREVLEARADPPEQIELVFPMTKDQDILEKARTENARVLKGALDRGDVAFISLGDIFFYSTFGNLLQGLRRQIPDLSVIIVPGVTSISAATALTGMPLVQGPESLAVVPATYEPDSLDHVLDTHETIVLMKVHRVFPAVLDLLERKGLVEKAVYLAEIGTSRQEIVTDIRTLKERNLPYMSLILVRKNLGGTKT